MPQPHVFVFFAEFRRQMFFENGGRIVFLFACSVVHVFLKGCSKTGSKTLGVLLSEPFLSRKFRHKLTHLGRRLISPGLGFCCSTFSWASVLVFDRSTVFWGGRKEKNKKKKVTSIESQLAEVGLWVSYVRVSPRGHWEKELRHTEQQTAGQCCRLLVFAHPSKPSKLLPFVWESSVIQANWQLFLSPSFQ